MSYASITLSTIALSLVQSQITISMQCTQLRIRDKLTSQTYCLKLSGDTWFCMHVRRAPGDYLLAGIT